MSESATHDAIEAVLRNSYGQLIAYLAARTGDVAGAEDAIGDAFVAVKPSTNAQKSDILPGCSLSAG